MGFSPLTTLAAAVQAPLDYIPPAHRESWVSNIATDSRDIRENALFIALTGERFDGHGFVEAAIAQGAVAAVVQQDKVLPHLPCLPVADTLVAYQTLGHWWRTQQQARIIWHKS